jgi:hypothetical protein
MKTNNLAKLIGIQVSEVREFLDDQNILKIEEGDFPLSREECVMVASHFINKLGLRREKQQEIRNGLADVFSFKRTEQLFRFLDNENK